MTLQLPMTVYNSQLEPVQTPLIYTYGTTTEPVHADSDLSETHTLAVTSLPQDEYEGDEYEGDESILAAIADAPKNHVANHHIAQLLDANVEHIAYLWRPLAEKHLFTVGHSNVFVTQTTLNAETTVCDECGGNEWNGVIVTVDRKDYCETCQTDHLSMCANCNSHYLLDTGGENVAGDPICESCSEDYFQCDGCGNTYHNDDYRGDGYCGDCANCSDYANGVHPYGYKPDFIFFGGNWHGINSGFEYELHNHNGVNDDHIAAFKGQVKDGLIYFCDDSSIDPGVEIISHPMSRRFWRDNLEDIGGLATVAARNGFRPREIDGGQRIICGFHVHVSKEPLKSGQLLAIVELLYGYPDFTFAISSRRTFSDLEHWASISEDASVRLDKCSKKYGGHRGTVHMRSSRDKTVEFRFLGSSIKPLTIKKNLETIAMLLDFGEQYDGKLDSVNPVSFVQFADRAKEQYPNFWTWAQLENRMAKMLGTWKGN